MIETDIEALERESQAEAVIADGLTAIGVPVGSVTLRPVGMKRPRPGRTIRWRVPTWNELL